jgi:CheY-like chemotaxis protein
VVDGNPVDLFVDDDKTISESVVDLLELSGFLTLHTGNGALAMQVLNTRRPDIIVSDVMMPEMDGFTFQETLWKIATWCRKPCAYGSGRAVAAHLDR